MYEFLVLYDANFALFSFRKVCFQFKQEDWRQIKHSVTNKGSTSLHRFLVAVWPKRSAAQMAPPLVTRFDVISYKLKEDLLFSTVSNFLHSSWFY